MRLADPGAPGEVGARAGEPQRPRPAATAQGEAALALGQRPLPRCFELDHAAQLLVGDLAVGAAATEPVALALPRLLDPAPHRLRALARIAGQRRRTGLGHAQRDVEAVGERPAEPRAVAGDLLGAAPASGRGLAVPAAARIGGGDQLKARRKAHRCAGSRDRHRAGLQRLAQRLEAGARELAELVQEEHAAMPERCAMFLDMQAAIYARISDDRDGDGLGVGRQLEDCRGLAERKGWSVVEEYIDNDVSAYKRRVRPAYRRLLDDIADGVVEGLVVYHLDRLHRQPRELEEFFEVCDGAGVNGLASVTGDVDLSTDDGRFMARIQGAVARKESDDKSRRIRRKALELARSGKVGGGGTRPYGFESDRMTLRADEAAVIGEAAGRVLAGETVRSVCVDLNARGIQTVTGREWVPQVLTRLLKSARISGQREHHGEIVADAEWSAIIPKQDGARLRAILSDPARRKNGRVRRYLLAGMLRCGRCGEPLVSRPRDDGRRRYVCARRPGSDACGKLAVMAEELEELVVEMVTYRIEGPNLARTIEAARSGVDEGTHQQEVDEAAGQLEELGAAYGERKITMSEWMAAREPIEVRLSKAKTALARSSGTSAVGEFIGTTDLRSTWGHLPLSRRRAILGTLIEYVTINPAVRGRNRFDPARVAPVWKF